MATDFILLIRLILVVPPASVGTGWFAYNYVTSSDNTVKVKWPVIASVALFALEGMLISQYFPAFEPDDYKANAYIAKWAVGNGRLDIAEASLAKLIELDPSNHTNWVERGKALMRLERFDEAETYYSKMLEMFPESEDAKIGSTYAKKRELAP
jgi:tetratricopeptide (TPR) repeat protein